MISRIGVVLQVAQQRRVAEHEVVDVLVRIGRTEGRAAAALELDRRPRPAR